MKVEAGAGDLRERVTIQAQRRTADGSGGHVRYWETVTTVWAKVLPTRGRQDLAAEALQGVQGYRITVRFRPDVEIDDRIGWRGKVLNVVSSADVDGSRAFTVIYTDAGLITE